MDRSASMRKRTATTITTVVEEKLSRRDGKGYKERQKFAMQRPKVFLTMQGLYGVQKAEEQSAGEKEENFPPMLLIRDLQYLLVYALRRGRNYDQPRWCNLLRPGKMSSAVMIVLNGVSVNDFHQDGDCFPFIQERFKENLRVTMVNPAQYFSSFSFEMYSVPLTMSQFRGYKRIHGNATHRDGVEVVFPTTTRAPAVKNRDSDDQAKDRETVCRTHLTLSAYEMVLEKYPHPESPQYAHFVHTNENYAKITSKSPLFALDCEMVLTSAFVHELARVSIYSENGEKVYDELVKPYNPIVDPLTRFSGITKKMLEPVTKRLEDVQREICKLLPSDAILCGQSLENDLVALKMYHPYVIDTSVIYNLSGCRKMKCGLKRLAYVFLGRVIQDSASGHSSAEDALATLDLVKLKLRKWFSFGDAVVGGNVMPFLPVDPINLAVERELAQWEMEGIATRSSHFRRVYGGIKPQPPVMMRSLFDILCEEQVSACQIGGKSLLSSYQEQPGLISCFAKTDEAACEMAGDCAKSYMFTWVEFSPFSKHRATHHLRDQEEEAGAETSEAARPAKGRRKALKSVDQCVKTLVEQLWEKSLVIVVLTGNGKGSSSQDEPVAAFLHIT